jgi:hypothetical protein
LRKGRYVHPRYQDAAGNKDWEALKSGTTDLVKLLQPVHVEYTKFKDEYSESSSTFALWDQYIHMIHILLWFIRAERERVWDLHLAALAEMIPYFFAYDRINYARWATVYLIDMQLLPQKAPEVYQEFQKGNHPVNRSANAKFNQVWTDMALEQSENCDSKSKGGVCGRTQKDGALDRWYITAHKRAAVTTATKAMCGMVFRSTGDHKDIGHTRIACDEKDVTCIVNTVRELMTNPFDMEDVGDNTTSKLVNIATGAVATSQVEHDLIKAHDLGNAVMESYVEKRLNTEAEGLFEPRKKMNLKTFKVMNKTVKLSSGKNEAAAIGADREFFSRLIIVANTRSIDLREVLKFELSAVPCSLMHPNGSLRSTAKSKLLGQLEEEVKESIVRTRQLPHSEQESTGWIIDGMASIQMQKPTGIATTFGEYARQLYKDVIQQAFSDPSCTRVDVVFDQIGRASCRERV